MIYDRSPSPLQEALEVRGIPIAERLQPVHQLLQALAAPVEGAAAISKSDIEAAFAGFISGLPDLCDEIAIAPKLLGALVGGLLVDGLLDGASLKAIGQAALTAGGHGSSGPCHCALHTVNILMCQFIQTIH